MAVLQVGGVSSAVLPSETTSTTANDPTALVHPQWAGVVVNPAPTIHSAEGLSRIAFDRCINGQLGLSSTLASQVAVLALDPKPTAAVLLLASTATEDVVQGVLQTMQARAIQLGASAAPEANTTPQAYVATPQIIMSVVDEALSADDNRRRRGVLANTLKSAHWETFKSIVQWAYDHEANDIDFVLSLSETTSAVYYKIHNRYVTQPRWAMPTRLLEDVLGVAWQSSKGGAAAELQLRVEQQAAIELDLANHVRVRLRMSTMPTERGNTITFRVQALGNAKVVHSLAQAGYLPPQIELFERAIVGKGGLTTLAGTVGSGKSVTLSILMALMHQMRPSIKGVTFEDPVEILSPWMHQRTITRDLHSADDRDFRAATAALFRSAVDVFLLGEVRDIDTGRVVRAVLESGHSVYTTTHAKSALGIISKYSMPQIGIPLETLATPDMLRLNVYQSLLLQNCGHCSHHWTDHAAGLQGTARHRFEQMLDAIEHLYSVSREMLRFRNSAGCDHCRQPGLEALWGYAGRTVCAEQIEPDETMCELIGKADYVGLHRYWRSLSDNDLTSELLAGKSAMEVALIKASRGQIDPHEIERDFEGFAARWAKAQAHARQAAIRRAQAIAASHTTTHVATKTNEQCQPL